MANPPKQPWLERSLNDYLAATASDAPTPGGGGAAGLTGALAMATAAMAARFTLGRPKYADVADEIAETVAVLDAAREALAASVDADAEAFAAIGAAYGLPRNNSGEAAARDAAVQQALSGAAAVPLGMLRALAAATPKLARLAAVGNPNLVSDTGVGAELARAAAAAAALNVRVNTALLRDAAAAAALDAEVGTLCAAIEKDAAAAVLAVAGRLPARTGLNWHRRN